MGSSGQGADAKLNTVHVMVKVRCLRRLAHVARQEDTILLTRLIHSKTPNKADKPASTREPKCWPYCEEKVKDPNAAAQLGMISSG